jgi:hypothetical protein
MVLFSLSVSFLTTASGKNVYGDTKGEIKQLEAWKYITDIHRVVQV